MKKRFGTISENWSELTHTDQVDEIISESKKNPVLIFKHSTRCSISSTVLDRLLRKWDVSEMGHVKMYELDLIRFRDISNQIVDIFEIAHESPQILLIEDGKCRYTESHFGIEYDVIKQLTKESEDKIILS